MIKCAPEKDPSTYIRTIQLVLFVWGYLVNGNNPKENKSHLSEDVPSSTVHHNNESYYGQSPSGQLQTNEA